MRRIRASGAKSALSGEASTSARTRSGYRAASRNAISPPYDTPHTTAGPSVARLSALSAWRTRSSNDRGTSGGTAWRSPHSE